MLHFDDLQLFVRAADLGSLSAAARVMDLSPAVASAALKRIEEHLGARLLARSTRSLRLTAEGARYLPYAQETLATLEAGRDRLHGDGARLGGVLQVAAPSDLGRNVLLPWLTTFRQTHPALTLRLHVSDSIADVFRDPVDVAIRYGRMEDASYIALPLAPDNRRVLVASPAYLQQHGCPRTLDDLAGHDCLPFQIGGRVYDKWVFPQPAGPHRLVAVGGHLYADDGEVVRRWALAGEGIAYKSWLDVGDDVRAGRLEVLLPQVRGEATPLVLVCPHRKQYSPAVQQLQRLLHARCSALTAQLPEPAA